MPHEFRLPDIGEGLTEAEIVAWLVREGDEVGLDQPIVEVETAKTTVEIAAPLAGTILELLAAPGDTVAVGAVLFVIGSPGGDEAQAPTASDPAHAKPEPGRRRAPARASSSLRAARVGTPPAGATSAGSDAIQGAIATKPGSATVPFFGVVPVLLTDKGEVIEGPGEGVLCIGDSWPGQMRTVYGDHQRFVDTYFKTYSGKYFTGDGCRRDADGYYWITGRVDDVINVSGHRIGTAEVESALVAHPKVAEAAVVGFPHDIKGQGIYAYVTLKSGEQPTEALSTELSLWVRKEIGAIASPDLIQFAPGLPKTRSGKIMRRILRKIAEDEYGSLGDTSTLADPAVVDDLVTNRQNKKSA